jgi:DNA-binding response OmpR family regulator
MRDLPAFLDDFLAPPYDPVEALARLRLLLFRRRHVEGGDQVRYHDLTLDLATGRAYAAGSTQEIALTPREWELLRFLVTNQGRRYGRERLVDLVWGVHYEGGPRTVDIHIRRLRAKLPPEAGQRLETLRGIGYGFAAATTSNPRRGSAGGGSG